MKSSHLRVRNMVLCALFAALTAVCSQISLPMPGGVPINLALFSVYLSAGLLGTTRGVISQMVYVGLAAIGIPVMAGFVGGPALLFGRTGGYVLGYVLAALAVGLLSALWGHGFARLCLAMVIGCLACYCLGTAWFMVVTGTNLQTSLALCVLPFLPGDAVKIALAALLVGKLKKALPSELLQ